MIKVIHFLLFSVLCNVLNSQAFSGKYLNECEYLNFLNDSLVEYSIFVPVNEAAVARYCGYGLYLKRDSNLTIINIDKRFDLINQNVYCTNCFYNTKSTDKYIIRFRGDGSMFLKGPILEKYEKYNRKGIQSFLHLRKRHWFEPMQRILTK